MNPFDELGLDPRLGPRELTEELRRRAERATGEERHRIQELWRKLTVNDVDRVRWAFLAHPREASTDPSSIAALRDKVPAPVIRAQAPALSVAVADVLVSPPTRPAGRTRTLRPPLPLPDTEGER